MYPIKSKKVECKSCYKCIKNCSANAIKLRDDEIIILEDRCVLCGSCINICEFNALSQKNTTMEITNLIKENTETIAIVDPSYKIAFGKDSEKLFTALKKIGFSKVFDTSLGGEIVLEEYIKILKQGEMETIITSTCPTINLEIIKYHEDLTKYLLPVEQPSASMAKVLKEKFENCKIVNFVPCLSFFSSNSSYSKAIDETMSFNNLEEWLENENIIMSELTNEENKIGSYARLFPAENGIINNIKEKMGYNSNEDEILGYTFISVSSKKMVDEILRDIIKGKFKKYFIEIFSCEKGCVSIPLKLSEGKSHNVHKAQKIMKNFASEKNINLDFFNDIDFEKIGLSKVFEKNIVFQNYKDYVDILDIIGTVDGINEKNCKKCGFNTCKEYALALHRNEAAVNLCDPNKTENSTLDQISNKVNTTLMFVLDENHKIIEINKMALKVFNASKELILNQNINNLLDKEIFQDIFVNKISEYNKKIKSKKIGLILEYSLIYIAKNNVAVCILKDNTEKELKEEKFFELKVQSVKIAQEVIDKQMVVAQQIASLLGETTAETKATLNKLKNLLLVEGVENIEK